MSPLAHIIPPTQADPQNFPQISRPLPPPTYDVESTSGFSTSNENLTT